MINTLEIFDKGNAATRVTVTANNDVRIKLGKNIKEEDKKDVLEFCKKHSFNIISLNISTTYRKTITDKILIDKNIIKEIDN